MLLHVIHPSILLSGPVSCVCWWSLVSYVLRMFSFHSAYYTFQNVCISISGSSFSGDVNREHKNFMFLSFCMYPLLSVLNYTQNKIHSHPLNFTPPPPRCSCDIFKWQINIKNITPKIGYKNGYWYFSFFIAIKCLMINQYSQIIGLLVPL